MRRGVLPLVLLLTTGARSVAASPPELVWSRGSLSLRRLPEVLSERTVARHLGTGLTTRFVFTFHAGLGGTTASGNAQVRVRYDLWDERYRVERWDARPDSPAGATLTREELSAWWRSLGLVFCPLATGLRAPPAQAKVELLVLPFSQAEQRDAQDWLLRAFRAPEGSAQESAGPGQSTSSGPLRAFYGALLAASIGQRSLIKYSWAVTVITESQ